MAARFQCLDDFLPNPEEFRQRAVDAEYCDIKGPDGEYYRNISLMPGHEVQTLLETRIDANVKMGYSMLRRNFDGEMPNNSVHSDNGYDQFAAVLYLNLPEQCRGGTAFWKHRKYGFDEYPDVKTVKRMGKSPNRVFNQFQADYNNESAWEQVDLAEMQFNRMVLYPTKKFHSRWPWPAWGDNKDNCRLIWVGFFSVV